MGVGEPFPPAVNVAVSPALIVTLVGCVVITGADTEGEEVALDVVLELEFELVFELGVELATGAATTGGALTGATTVAFAATLTVTSAVLSVLAAPETASLNWYDFADAAVLRGTETVSL